MDKKRYIISVLMVWTILVSSVFAVFPELSVERVHGEVGEEVSVDIKLNTISNVEHLSITVEYDSEALQLIPSKIYYSNSTKDWKVDTSWTETEITIDAVNNQVVDTDLSLHLATLTFKVLDTSKEEVPIRIKSASMLDHEGKGIPVKLEHGNVSIINRESHIPEPVTFTLDSNYYRSDKENDQVVIDISGDADYYEILIKEEVLNEMNNQSLLIMTPYMDIELSPAYIDALRRGSSTDVKLRFDPVYREGIGTIAVDMSIMQGSGTLRIASKDGIKVTLKSEGLITNVETTVPNYIGEGNQVMPIVTSVTTPTEAIFLVDQTGYYFMREKEIYFEDVVGSWAESYVYYLAAREVIQGKSTYQFAPNDYVKAYELGLILERIDDYEIGELEGQRYLTREEVCEILVEFANQTGISLQAINTKKVFEDDEQLTNPEAVYRLQQAGIIDGDEKGYFNPEELVTRAQISKMVSEVIRLKV